MTILVIPAAGQSKRYGLERPKFLLQHPKGGTMLQAAIRGLGPLLNGEITAVHIASLREFFQDISQEKITEEIQDEFSLPCTFHLLDSPTTSMVDTLNQVFAQIEDDVPVIVKDCDSNVELRNIDFLKAPYAISFADLRKFPQVTAHNKSFLEFGANQNLTGIVEKMITSPFINVGCIKFRSISEFLAASMELRSSSEVFVSDVIRVLIENQNVFVGYEVENYDDWGTLADWNRYKSSFATLFIDLDGVVAVNENPYSRDGGWHVLRPIHENIQTLKLLSESEKIQLVFVTARASIFAPSITRSLEEQGLKDFLLLTNMQHSQRVLINDFADTNVFPTALSVNLPRNHPNLGSYLSQFFG